jgi:hypothetical protein
MARLRKNGGQSTVEFLLTLVFSIAFLFLFVQLAINAGIGYLNHYATFMASRAYLVYDDNNQLVDSTLNQAEDFVRGTVMKQFGLDILGIDNDDIETNTLVNSPANGTKKYEYLLSESFLGKEPTRGDCLERICNYTFEQHVGFLCNTQVESSHITVFDNGC